jgi:DNA processing protein
MDERRGLLDLMLSCMGKLKPKEKYELSLKLNREEDLRAWIQSHGGLFGPEADFDALRREAEANANEARKRSLAWVGAAERGYPPLLRELHDPPCLLYYMGRLPDQGKPLAAIVGTRKPTGAGSAQSYTLAKALALAGITVVSGLALGIDAMAHRGCVDAEKATVAVLGSGLAYIYPSQNRGLARRILQNGGALVSEYGPLTHPERWTFPARNRIIAGLSRATIVVEAPEKSGALITAQDALDTGRDVWVGSVGMVSPQGAGTAALVRDGARVLEGDVKPLLEDWGIKEEPLVRL